MAPNWAHDPELNSFEKVKLEKDGLDIIEKLEDYRVAGFDSISMTERDLLKWAGVYLQRPKTAGFFMMRVKIPSGILNSEQAQIIADISKRYGRNIIDITTRQAFQFHWITIETLPDILKMLYKVNLNTIEACGDCPRTVIGNPLAGIDPDEVIDTREIIREVFELFQNNRDFSNLPRKFKISISSNIYNAAHAEINDLAFTPAKKKINNEEVYGFHVYVGGGLSINPYLADKLDIFVKPSEVLKVAIGVATIFRDYGNRKKRNQSRLKFLLMDWGWEKFQAELQKITGPLESSGIDLTRGWNAGYFYGLHEQKQAGLYYLGLSIPVGRMTSEDLIELASLADKYGDGSLRTCNSKNIVIANIPFSKTKAIMSEKLLNRFSPNPTPFVSYAVSCTGKEFCNLALVETKKRALEISSYLDKNLKLNEPIRINVNGCPNSCGQLQIADIGLRGRAIKVNGLTTEVFEIAIGGILGPKPNLAISLHGTVPAESVKYALEYLLKFYRDNRLSYENFNQFVNRVGIEEFQKQLNDFNNSNNFGLVAR